MAQGTQRRLRLVLQPAIRGEGTATTGPSPEQGRGAFGWRERVRRHGRFDSVLMTNAARRPLIRVDGIGRPNETGRHQNTQENATWKSKSNWICRRSSAPRYRLNASSHWWT